MCVIVKYTYTCARCGRITLEEERRHCCARAIARGRDCPKSNCEHRNANSVTPWQQCRSCMAEYNAWLASQRQGHYYQPNPPFL
ncbi:Uncharacterized protein HZ326_0316 [Fusarium oxysporum f. sp. albedinis]|nr:Uncharacterized protein HZ326_0316 [Fusarium oxysporum f. sp. albedinis]